jgi:RNA methyltransferase, TrmH family
VKAVVQLHQRKHREAEQLILIEGRHPLEEAIAAHVQIQEIYLREAEPSLRGASCEQVPVTDAVMAKMSTTDTPPPVLAVAKRPVYETDDFFNSDNAFVLGLVELQDPGNLGTLIRSACAFGVTAIATVGPHVDPYNPKVIRASAGLVFRLPLGHIDGYQGLRNQVEATSNLTIWGADAHQGASYRATSYAGKVLLLLGGEAHGLPEGVWDLAKPLHIPMMPGVESLNVGMAGAIILAEAYQQRHGASIQA